MTHSCPCTKCLIVAMCIVCCEDLNEYIQFLKGFDLDLVGYKFIDIKSKGFVITLFEKGGKVEI